MKKFGIVILVAVFCMALAMPAMAAMRISGSVQQSVSYDSSDQNYMQNNQLGRGVANEAAYSNLGMGEGFGSKIHFNFTNSAKNMGALIGFNPMDEQFQTSIGPESTRSRYMMGWWQINPKIKLTVGQQDVVYGGYAALVTYELCGFGNTEPDRERGLRLDIKLSKTASLSVGAFKAEENGGVVTTSTLTGSRQSGTLWNTNAEERREPRWEVELSAKVGPVWISPGYYVGKINYEYDMAESSVSTHLSQQSDSSISYSGWHIGAMTTMGPLTIMAEYNRDDNLGNSSLQGYSRILGVPSAEWHEQTAGVFKVYDAERKGWWTQINYNGLGWVNLSGYWGEEETEMDRPGTAFDWKFKREKWGIGASRTINRQMSISCSYGKEEFGNAQVGVGGPFGLSAAASQGVTNNANLGSVTKVTLLSFYMWF